MTEEPWQGHTDPERTQMPIKAKYPAKLSIIIHGENKLFYDKSKFKQYPALQRILEEKL